MNFLQNGKNRVFLLICQSVRRDPVIAFPAPDARNTERGNRKLLPDVSAAVAGTAVSRMRVMGTGRLAGVGRVSGMSSTRVGRVVRGGADGGCCRS